MTLYEINYAPTKRVVRGVHMWDIAYRVQAASLEDAKAYARRCIAVEAPAPIYKLTSAREVAA